MNLWCNLITLISLDLDSILDLFWILGALLCVILYLKNAKKDSPCINLQTCLANKASLRASSSQNPYHLLYTCTIKN